MRNAGNADAVNAVVTAALPPNAQPGTVSDSGRFERGLAVWTAPTLPPSGFIDLQFTASLDSGVSAGALERSLSAFAADNAATRAAQVQTLVRGQPLLIVDKTGPANIEINQEVDYQIAYGNIGTAIAPATVLEDQLPSGTTFVSASAGGAEVSPGSGLVRWDIGNLAPGVTSSVDLTLKVGASVGNTTLVNQTALKISGLRGAVTDQVDTVVEDTRRA